MAYFHSVSRIHVEFHLYTSPFGWNVELMWIVCNGVRLLAEFGNFDLVQEAGCCERNNKISEFTKM